MYSTNIFTKIHFYVFPIFFQNLMGPKNEGVTFLVVLPNHTFTHVVPFIRRVHCFANKTNLVVIILFDVLFMH